jgi:hypothetical protein
MCLLRTAIVVVSVGGIYGQQLHAQSSRPTDAQITEILIKESRDAYHATGHPCACPDDHMRNGRSCGRVSAYSRPGGAEPLCYPRDVTKPMIEAYRKSH